MSINELGDDSQAVDNPRTFWEIQPIRTLTKYFENGRIETWLSNEENEELYLIKHYQHPSGQSPIVELKKLEDEL